MSDASLTPPMASLPLHGLTLPWSSPRFLQHGDWLPQREVKAAKPLKDRPRAGTTSLLPHLIDQTKSQFKEVQGKEKETPLCGGENCMHEEEGRE